MTAVTVMTDRKCCLSHSVITFMCVSSRRRRQFSQVPKKKRLPNYLPPTRVPRALHLSALRGESLCRPGYFWTLNGRRELFWCCSRSETGGRAGGGVFVSSLLVCSTSTDRLPRGRGGEMEGGFPDARGCRLSYRSF